MIGGSAYVDAYQNISQLSRAKLDIVNGNKTVASGKRYISPSISSFLVNRTARDAELAQQKHGIHQLTQMERRILKLIAEKKTSKEIASALLGISTHKNGQSYPH